MLISGIGDALATYIEAEASYANNNVCNAGDGAYKPTRMAMALAKLSYDILLEKGLEALRAAKCHARTPAYEDVAEATILLSALALNVQVFLSRMDCRRVFMFCPIRDCCTDRVWVIVR